MKIQVLLFCQILFISLLNSQTLERGGSLGAYLAPVETNDGVLIQNVIPNTTSDAIGLKAEDIIKSVNGIAVSSTAEIVTMTKSWRANDPLKLQLIRAGTTIELKGKVKGKPTETSKNGIVEYGSVAYDGGQLRSILICPIEKINPPVIFFLQGFSCSSIDYYYNQQSIVKQLTEDWVAAGFAVYRVEKPGMGDSKGLPNCEDIGYNYEVAAFETALKKLKTIPQINSESVYLFGHSLGGITAPLLAAKVPVKGIINYGSIATTWYEYLIKVLREQEAITGSDYAYIEKNVRRRTKLLYDYLIQKKSPKELEQNPEYKEIMPTGIPLREGDKMIGRHFTFMQEINDANIVEAFKKAGCHVLALHGEFDLHAVDEEWAKQTADILNTYYPGKGSWKIITGTEHGFASVPSMEAYIEMRNDGAFDSKYMSTHYNPAVAQAVIDWIKKLER
jgi:pimeloyl-ACP methyl ester carboxylesterase